MKNRFHPLARRPHRRGILERCTDEIDAALLEVGCGRPAENPHATAGAQQAPDQVAAEETGSAGDKDGRAGE
jgi:hypothetical protein